MKEAGFRVQGSGDRVQGTGFRSSEFQHEPRLYDSYFVLGPLPRNP